MLGVAEASPGSAGASATPSSGRISGPMSGNRDRHGGPGQNTIDASMNAITTTLAIASNPPGMNLRVIDAR